jgi:hypothetical protein
MLWIFVCAVTCFDVVFALTHAATFDSWELNPAMRWVAAEFGIATAAAFRISSVVFALLIIREAQPMLRRQASRVIFAVHLALMLVYLPLCFC